MKRILLVLLVLLGLQTQAQITLCDSNMTYTTGSQYQLEVAIPVTGNNLPFMAPLYAVTHGDGNMLDEDSCFSGPCTHMIYNYNMSTGMPYDTLMTCISYTVTDTMGYIDTLMCCFSQYWDGQAWARMMQQQPYFCCDSITYWTDQSQGLTVGLDTTNMIHNPDSMTVYWGVCTGYAGGGICYTGNGISDYFPQVTTSDTIKVGYDVYIYENGVVEVCSMEEWLIFDQNTYSWVLLNMLPTSINELTFNRSNDGKIYDLLGRELTEIPVGKLYIRNQKLYITR